jgi:hypothetical protein
MSTRAACGAIRRSITHHCAEQARPRNGRSSPHPGDGGARVNKRLLDGAQALSGGREHCLPGETTQTHSLMCRIEALWIFF